MNAIEFAEANDLLLNKYADPTEEARTGLTPDEARAVAREDAGLIWIETDGLTFAGWSEGDGTSTDGYHAGDYFVDGQYLGADEHGIEPRYAA